MTSEEIESQLIKKKTSEQVFDEKKRELKFCHDIDVGATPFARWKKI